MSGHSVKNRSLEFLNEDENNVSSLPGKRQKLDGAVVPSVGCALSSVVSSGPSDLVTLDDGNLRAPSHYISFDVEHPRTHRRFMEPTLTVSS
jgi:hypothetical protein